MKVILPSKNLGCLGIKVSDRIYFDFFRNPYYGIFLRFYTRKWWINLEELRISGDRV